MIRSIAGSVTVLLSFLTLWLHMNGLQNNWYFYHSWYDLPLHFLGGLTVGALFLFLSIMITEERGKEWSREEVVTNILLGTLIIGIGWEIFEYIAGLTFVESYVLDTTVDLLLDIAGGLSVAIVFLYALDFIEKKGSQDVIEQNAGN